VTPIAAVASAAAPAAAVSLHFICVNSSGRFRGDRS
jgi:hypothetical protein